MRPLRARSRLSGLLAVGLAVALAALLGAGPAQAESPPEVEKAELLYSNGGRILSIKADGSERRVLTRSGKVVRSFLDGPRGDRLPKLSPDGARILFFRETDEAPFDSTFSTGGKNMLANADGSGVREILKPSGNVGYRDVSWMPDGSIVAAKRVDRGARFKFRTERSVVTMNLDGSNQRTIFRLGYHLQGNLQQDLSTYFMPIELAPSPDGESLLVTIQNGYRNDGRRLELVSTIDGTRALIARKSYSGGWSPDGESIVFASDRAQNGKVCSTEDGCRVAGDIFIADSDGSDQRALVSGQADEADPSWSPDGQAIAFSSTRIKPREEFSSEIYSVRPDGTCLTWLTNGSPASITPRWGPSGSGDPGACGATDRPALVAGSPPPMERWYGPRLWLGPEVGDALYSDGFVFFGLGSVSYADCSRFNPSACPPPVAVSSISNCLLKASFATLLAAARKPKKPLRMRGVRVLRSLEDDKPFTLVFSGGAIVTPGADLFFDDEATSGTFREQLDLVQLLRAPGATDGSANLAPMLTPRFAIRKARKIARVVRRTGSVRQAAKRLKAKPRFVRVNLAFRRNARWFGPIRPLNCPREADFLDAFDSGQASSSSTGDSRSQAAATWSKLLRGLLR